MLKFLQWFNQLSSFYKNFFVLFSSFGTGLLALIPAYFTEWINESSPMSYMIVFATGVLGLSLIYFLLSLAIFYWERGHYYSKFTLPKSDVNPLDRNVQNKRIFLRDFETPFDMDIKNKALVH